MNVKRTAFLLLVSSGMVTRSAPPTERTEIYQKALIEAAKEMEKEWGDLKGGPLDESTPTDYKHLLVCTDESVPDDYPANVGERHFDYVTKAELLSRRKLAERNFSVLIVNPARIEGSRVKVVVEQRVVRIEQGRLTLAISDWGAVFFRFDCEKKELLFDEVKLGGI